MRRDGATSTRRRQALVTGAHGFVGRHLARALAAREWEVLGLGHGLWTSDEWHDWGLTDCRLGDVTLETLITFGGEPDAIFHCAGSGSVAFSMTNPYQDYQRTVATTHSVLEYIRTFCSAAVLVLPSSAAVYGVAQTMPIRVTAPIEPASAYGFHKRVTEDLCRMYGQHFGVRSSLIRFFSIYGVGLRKQLLWDACRKIADGEVTFSGTGQETRDWIHVEDAASLMIRASKYATADSAVINGGTGKATQISDMVCAIADEFSGSRRPEFSGTCRPGDPVDYQADITQALDWGWRPTRDLHEEVRRYVHWFKDGAP